MVAFVDNIMVGKLGTAPLAAVSLGNSFVFIAMAIGIGFSTAITPLIAEADSENNTYKGKTKFQHGLILCTIMGIVLFFGILLLKPLIHYLDQPEEVVILALPYLDIIAFSLIPLIIFQAFKQFADGMSHTKYAMYATIVANLVNVLLNYLLIYGIWIFPELGIVGAGIGTLISRVVMVLILYYILNSRIKFKPFLELLSISEIKKSIFKKIINLGFPSALQMLFEVGIFTAAIWLSGTLGKNPQAANQIALNLSSMTFMVAIGLGVAATVRIGNQKGLQNYKDLRRIGVSIFLLVFLIEVVFAACFMIFNEILPLMYLDLNETVNYVDNMEVISIAAKLLLIAALFQISDGLQVVVLGALRGMQDVTIPTIFTFIAYWMIGFPLSYYLGKVYGLGSAGIWIGLLGGLTASAILLSLRFNYLTKKLIKKHHYEIT